MKILALARQQVYLRGIVILLLGLLFIDQVSAQRFGDLNRQVNQSNSSNAYTGNSLTGNTITRVIEYQNTSNLTYVVKGVRAVYSLDPEDLGFPDLTPDNIADIRRATIAMFPDADILNLTGWVFRDPPRKSWTTEVRAVDALPLVVTPGDIFRYVRISTNDDFGPGFGPQAAGNMSFDQIDRIGEVSTAIELNWFIVPEPTTVALVVAGLISALSGRRR